MISVISAKRETVGHPNHASLRDYSSLANFTTQSSLLVVGAHRTRFRMRCTTNSINARTHRSIDDVIGGTDFSATCADMRRGRRRMQTCERACHAKCCGQFNCNNSGVRLAVAGECACTNMSKRRPNGGASETDCLCGCRVCCACGCDFAYVRSRSARHNTRGDCDHSAIWYVKVTAAAAAAAVVAVPFVAPDPDATHAKTRRAACSLRIARKRMHAFSGWRNSQRVSLGQE